MNDLGVSNIFSRLGILLLILVFNCEVKSQSIYKTPYGKKYHLSSCRMVENVSSKLVGGTDVENYDLQPCKICNPPEKEALINTYVNSNKAVGESISIQCKGLTKKGLICKHKTSIANGYCYQHTSQIINNLNIDVEENDSTPSYCGAKNKSGGHCRRKVKGGGHCYQHD